jgi:hypothetical protein
MTTSIAVNTASGQQFVDLPYPLTGRLLAGTPAVVSFSIAELRALLPALTARVLTLTDSTAAAADASWVAQAPERALAFGTAGTTVVGGVQAAKVTLTASTAATGADDVTIATAIPYGMQITRVRMVVTTTGTAGDTCTVRTATAAGGTAVSTAMACSAATAVDGTLTTTIPALAAAGSLYVRRTGNKMAGTIVLEFLPLQA